MMPKRARDILFHVAADADLVRVVSVVATIPTVAAPMEAASLILG